MRKRIRNYEKVDVINHNQKVIISDNKANSNDQKWEELKTKVKEAQKC